MRRHWRLLGIIVAAIGMAWWLMRPPPPDRARSAGSAPAIKAAKNIPTH